MQIHVATTNQGKLLEIQAMAEEQGIDILPADPVWMADVIESGETFVENALIKAQALHRYISGPVLADDSGLIIDALGGRPGVYSARYAGDSDDPHRHIHKVLAELEGVPPSLRQARFVSVLVLSRYPGDPLPLICEGRLEGRILLEPEGDQGFGYDPIFYVPETDCAVANLSLVDKNRLSHRGRALSALFKQLRAE